MNRRLAPVCLLLGCLAAPALGDDIENIPPPPQPQRPIGQGTHALRFILKSLDFQTVESFDELNQDARHGLLIVLGDTNVLQDERQALRDYINSGGAVLLATDLKTARIVEEFFGVSIDGERVEIPTHGGRYRGMSDCPVVTDINHDYDLFRQVQQIATNQPSRLLIRGRRPFSHLNFVGVALFPKGCEVKRKDGYGESGPLSVAAIHDNLAAPKTGRMLFLSDHSVFINSMMMQADNDNFLFAMNSIKWLSEDGQRNRVLIYDEGQVETSLDVPVKLKEIPQPSLDQLPGDPVAVLNALLGKWEQDNVHNELLFGRFSPGQILSLLAIAVTVVLLVYGLFRLQGAHHRAETSP